MDFETILTEQHDSVLLIRLNRPDALNALNSTLLTELGTALRDATTSEAVRVVVITGSERAFAAGADIKEMADKSFAEVALNDLFSQTAQDIQGFRKPIIAAVAGYALGGGCELAMLCDIIIAADTARFGQPEINLGVIPGLGGTQRLTRLVGRAKSMEMNLTGRQMDAAEAERAGLVSRVVPAESLLEDAIATAKTIAEKPMLAVLAAKEAVNRAEEISLNEGLLHERRLFHALFATEDQKEGMTAFMEKRKARFQDK